jgi:hypothetical protein
MNAFSTTQRYVEARAARLLRRAREDERGSATAEQIVMIGAAVIGAVAVGVIIWQKMQDGANSIQTPAP